MHDTTRAVVRDVTGYVARHGTPVDDRDLPYWLPDWDHDHLTVLGASGLKTVERHEPESSENDSEANGVSLGPSLTLSTSVLVRCASVEDPSLEGSVRVAVPLSVGGVLAALAAECVGADAVEWLPRP